MRIGVLDGPDMGRILRYGLTLVGYTVDIFSTVESFFLFLASEAEMAFSHRCDLVIVDALLPAERYSGGQILHEVRKKYPTLPVLLLLSVPPGIPLVGMKELSNVQIVQKPFTFATLLTAIQTVEASK